MSNPAANNKFSRKRVRTACQNCRALKAKCDGSFPVCRRCQGYGYQCLWPGMKRAASSRGVDLQADRQLDNPMPGTTTSLRNAIEAYENLIRSAYISLGADLAPLNLKFASIRRHLPVDLARQLPSPPESDATASTSSNPSAGSDSRIVDSQRYFGEVSDIQFFKSIQDAFQETSAGEESDEERIYSYDQDDLEQNNAAGIGPPNLPARQLASMFIDSYFSTIHIAFPFICKPLFLQQYDQFLAVGGTEKMDSDWMSLLYTIFAIGAFYVSFPCQEGSGSYPHGEYFRSAQMFARQHTESRRLNHVYALLLHCFYLLAVSKTDRCWTNLGLAIRIGQSIGLHVESPGTRTPTAASVITQEMRRRTWYSMCVLDRLLALQLGRPAAIHEGDYNATLPRACDDSLFDLANDTIVDSSEDMMHTNEYFLQGIRLSHIIGRVARVLYNLVDYDDSIEGMFAKATRLDQDLCDWRNSLPRTLRFDLSHTFEKSVTFQRQRNMLAIKFHHLRAIIHRPFLWSTRLQQQDAFVSPLSEQHQTLAKELRKICVSEARQTAHLLYKVPDERSLVQDFPWLQMISSLICTSAILLVASVGAELDGNTEDATSQTLDEDAETCLKVFDALSANSDAARLARKMMNDLKKARLRARSGDYRTGLSLPYMAPSSETVSGHVNPSTTLVHPEIDETPLQRHAFSDGAAYQFWPSEISEPMLWSSQFVDASYGAFEPTPE